MKTPTRSQRGSALITVMSLMVIILALSLGLLQYASNEQNRAVGMSRTLPKNYCVNAGMQLARAYFGRNFSNWNTYLAHPQTYNPVTFPGDANYATQMTTAPATGNASFNYTFSPPSTYTPPASNLMTTHPELYADLDGDGYNDVYIYIRDNADDLPPAASQNWVQDNDLQVIVGAVCISHTITPRGERGNVDLTLLNAEGILAYNATNTNYAQRCGASGTCNAN